MKFSILLLAAVFTFLGGSASDSTIQDSPVLVQGYVVHDRDSVPIIGAHVVNRNNNRITNTGQTGSFSILAKAGDSIFITAIGYELSRSAWNGGDGFMIVPLSPRKYQIDEVAVYPFPTPAHFKRAFIDLDLPGEVDKEPDAPAMRKTEVMSAPSGGFGITIPGPISGLYNLMSKEGKERRKLQKAMEEMRYSEEMETLFNAELIISITGIQASSVEAFMDYCQNLKAFRNKVRDDEFVSAVTDCYIEYKSK